MGGRRALLQFGVGRVLSPFPPPLWLPLPGLQPIRESLSRLDRFIYGLIAEKRRTLSGQNEDLLSTLMLARDEDTGESMNDRQLRDELMVFFLAGHESSALALTWTLSLLSRNPEVEVKLREELRTQSDGPYLKAVIQESMRVNPPLWSVARQALGDDDLGGYRIRKGDNLLFPPFLIHRDPRFWPEPLKFQPERFMSPRSDSILKHTYFPFGGGPRVCIGSSFAMMEMQLLLSMILKRFQIRFEPDSDPGFEFSLTLRPKRELQVRLASLNISS
jgi:cytochrome P450